MRPPLQDSPEAHQATGVPGSRVGHTKRCRLWERAVALTTILASEEVLARMVDVHGRRVCERRVLLARDLEGLEGFPDERAWIRTTLATLEDEAFERASASLPRHHSGLHGLFIRVSAEAFGRAERRGEPVSLADAPNIHGSRLGEADRHRKGLPFGAPWKSARS